MAARSITRSRLIAALGVAALVLTATACPPTGGPSAPTWVTTRAARAVTPGGTLNFVGGWTDENWAATMELFTSTTPGGSTATLNFYPRSGPGNSVLDTPQQVPVSIDVGITGPLGEHIVGLSGSQAIEFFREIDGVWASAGTVPLAAGRQMVALNDSWMVLRTVPASPTTDSPVEVFAVDASGPTVTVTPAATLHGDPAWPLALRNGFGSPAVALDGDLLAVAAQGMFEPAPGGLRLFRAAAGSWQPVQSLGAEPGGPNQFARSLAVDDGATVDRLVVGPQITPPAASVVDVYADTGAGFVPEQRFGGAPAGPDVYDGALFGSSVAIDGDLIAVTARGVKVPSSTPNHADVTVGYVQLFRKGATWAVEAEVPLFTTPGPAATVSAVPFRLQMAGNHVAVLVFVSPDPPVGCSFPCFNFGFEAWSIDRTG